MVEDEDDDEELVDVEDEDDDEELVDVGCEPSSIVEYEEEVKELSKGLLLLRLKLKVLVLFLITLFFF